MTGRAARLLTSLLVLSASSRNVNPGPQAPPARDPPTVTKDPTRGPYVTDPALHWMLVTRHHEVEFAVACVIRAWNAYDADAARKCYHRSAMAVWNGRRKDIDWEFERQLREFDAAAGSRFSFEIRESLHPHVEFTLFETNRLLEALGLKRVTARWRYTVREGQVVEEQLLNGDETFKATLQEFSRWGREQRPQGWLFVSDAKGNARFDGKSAHGLVRLAREWSRSRGSSPIK